MAGLLAILVPIAFGSCARSGNTPGKQQAAKVVETTSKSGVKLVLVPGGEFLMGSEAAGDESPRHWVQVGPFAMDQFEVTQRQMAELEIPDPSHFKSSDRPVEQIRWSDAALFCNARSQAEGLEPCYDEVTLECDFQANGYRLPLEAEWEYAARAGTDTDYFFDNSPRKLKLYACYRDNSKKKTDPVGRKRPNPWGLRDMLGNVAEWCNDTYEEHYYERSPADNPHGPEKGEKRVMRGGSWRSSAEACRVPARQGCVAGFTDACFTGDTLGFRCVRKLSPDELKQLGVEPEKP